MEKEHSDTIRQHYDVRASGRLSKKDLRRPESLRTQIVSCDAFSYLYKYSNLYLILYSLFFFSNFVFFFLEECPPPQYSLSFSLTKPGSKPAFGFAYYFAACNVPAC